jgi:hypothetical protein
VDAARSRGSGKRGGGVVKINLDEAPALSPEPDRFILALDEALAALAKLAPRQASPNTLHLTLEDEDSRRDFQVARRSALAWSQAVIAHFSFDSAWIDSMPARYHTLLENLVKDHLMKDLLLPRGE